MLSSLLSDGSRTADLVVECNGIMLDLTRGLYTQNEFQDLHKLIDNVWPKIDAMFAGEKINSTENREVLHVALRSQREGERYYVEGVDVVYQVHEVLSRIEKLSSAIRAGKHKSYCSKKFENLICVGIGGSYLGVEFVYEALKTTCQSGLNVHFLSNVDPIDVKRAISGFDPGTTFVIIISKTFTTAETIMNAQTVKDWLLLHYDDGESKTIGSKNEVIGSHFAAVSSNVKLATLFGIKEEMIFPIWDWVGGRFSVTSAVGVLPLSLIFGHDVVEEFLNGARDMDIHWRHERDSRKNLPILMALTSYFNMTKKKINTVAVLPYSQALMRFPAYIQQLTMESNGKSVQITGEPVESEYHSGEIFFGEPGTNGQHSFYQLIHQGQPRVACEFIGYTKSQASNTNASTNEIGYKNHDELMCNFFAQADALALGKSNTSDPHKNFTGNRPSMMLLFDGHCNAYNLGQLIALYEHRTATQGFLWNLNSFDQFGVELGKVMAKDVKNNYLLRGYSGGASPILDFYLKHR